MMLSPVCRSLYFAGFAVLVLVFGNNASADEENKSLIYADNFLLKQKDTGQCLVVMDEIEGCPAEEGGEMKGCDNSNRVVFEACNEERPGQRWVFDFHNKRIHSREGRAERCLTRLADRLSMADCQSGSLRQLWFFDQQDRLFSRVDVLSPRAFIKLLQPDTDRPSPVTFTIVDSETGDDQCYLSPFTGRVECPEFAMDEETIKQQEVASWNGSGDWPWQPKPGRLTEDLRLGEFHNNRCLAVEPCQVDSVGQYDCFGGGKIQVKTCQQTSHQVWRYDLVSKRLFNKQAGEQFCLSWLPGKLSLEHCFSGAGVSQRWYFARKERRRYSERGRLRWFSGPGEHYDYIKTVDFEPVVKFEILKQDSQGTACGYDPVDGLWKGLCTD